MNPHLSLTFLAQAAPAMPEPPNPVMTILPIVVFALLGGFVGALVGKSRGNQIRGFITGFIIGPLLFIAIGLIISLSIYYNPLLLIWPFIGMCVGGVIGQSRGRTGEGLIIGFLLGPIGWIILIFGPNPKKEAEEKIKDHNLQVQLDFQKQQLEELKRIQKASLDNMQNAEKSFNPSIRLAKNGVDLGEFEKDRVKSLLEAGIVSPEDYYFDTEQNNWLPIANIINRQ
jgi:uncharacterized membrane protein